MPKALDRAREAILAAARLLLERDGYASLTIRGIAAAGGMATGTVYNYFTAKDEIVVALMLEDWTRALERMEEGLSAEGAGEGREWRARCILHVYDVLGDFIRRYRAVWQVMASAPPEERSSSVACYDRQIFMREIGERIKRLVPRDGPEGAFLVDFTARILVSYAQGGECDRERLASTLARVLKGD